MADRRRGRAPWLDEEKRLFIEPHATAAAEAACEVGEVVGVVGFDAVSTVGKDLDLGDDTEAVIEELEVAVDAAVVGEVVVQDDTTAEHDVAGGDGVEVGSSA